MKSHGLTQRGFLRIAGAVHRHSGRRPLLPSPRVTPIS